MSSKKKKNTFRDRTLSVLQQLEGLTGLITRDLPRGRLFIRVLPTTRVPKSVADKIRKDVEARIPREEIKKTFEKPKETTWSDIINLVWKNKDVIGLVGKDLLKGMTDEPPMASVIEEAELLEIDEGKHDEGFEIDVGEIKISPAQTGELKKDVSVGTLVRNIPETEFAVVTEYTPIRELGILNRLDGDRGEIKRSITDNAQLQISDINIPTIQADVTEGSVTYPFFVGLTDRRYPVNQPIYQVMADYPIYQVMADYPNLDLVEMYGLQLERMRPEDLESL
jgi:hypothetical protein